MAQTEYVDNLAIIYRLELKTPDPENHKEMASMQFGFDGENPQIRVWPRGESQKGKPPIVARLNTTAFGNILADMLVKASQAEPGFKMSLPVLGNRFDEGKLVQKTVNTIVVGVNKEGIVVMGVFDNLDDSRPRILFPLILLDWVGTPSINGEPMGSAEISKRCAAYYAEAFKKMSLDKVLMQTVQERKKFMDSIRERREQAKQNRQPSRPSLNSQQGSDDFNF